MFCFKTSFFRYCNPITSSREAISKHLKDEARQRVINQWHNNKRFAAKVEAYVNGSSSSSQTPDGNQTLWSTSLQI